MGWDGIGIRGSLAFLGQFVQNRKQTMRYVLYCTIVEATVHYRYDKIIK